MSWLCNFEIKDSWFEAVFPNLGYGGLVSTCWLFFENIWTRFSLKCYFIVVYCYYLKLIHACSIGSSFKAVHVSLVQALFEPDAAVFDSIFQTKCILMMFCGEGVILGVFQLSFHNTTMTRSIRLRCRCFFRSAAGRCPNVCIARKTKTNSSQTLNNKGNTRFHPSASLFKIYILLFLFYCRSGPGSSRSLVSPRTPTPTILVSGDRDSHNPLCLSVIKYSALRRPRAGVGSV